jgi:hypothetical protein
MMFQGPLREPATPVAISPPRPLAEIPGRFSVSARNFTPARVGVPDAYYLATWCVIKISAATLARPTQAKVAPSSDCDDADRQA